MPIGSRQKTVPSKIRCLDRSTVTSYPASRRALHVVGVTMKSMCQSNYTYPLSIARGENAIPEFKRKRISSNLRADRASAGLVSALSQILVPDIFFLFLKPLDCSSIDNLAEGEKISHDMACLRESITHTPRGCGGSVVPDLIRLLLRDRRTRTPSNSRRMRSTRICFCNRRWLTNPLKNDLDSADSICQQTERLLKLITRLALLFYLDIFKLYNIS